LYVGFLTVMYKYLYTLLLIMQKKNRVTWDCISQSRSIFLVFLRLMCPDRHEGWGIGSYWREVCESFNSNFVRHPIRLRAMSGSIPQSWD
jgi:hypothetical protein